MTRSLGSTVFVGALCLAVELGAAQAGLESGHITQAVPLIPDKPASRPDKLDPGLRAIATAWRRYGRVGAEREAAARQVPMRSLRVAAVVSVSQPDSLAEVERAIRKVWGEVVWSDHTTVAVQLPVPAIRRISRMPSVQFVTLDDQLAPLAPHSAPPKETPR